MCNIWPAFVDQRSQNLWKLFIGLVDFHTMMSLMSSIGSVMEGSGLEEALETA